MTPTPTRVERRRSKRAYAALDALIAVPHTIEFDRKDREWLLTQRLDCETTIRLRIRHTGPLDPDKLTCELADDESGETFTPLASFLWHPEDDPSIFDWPLGWVTAFMRLADAWAVCRALVVYAPSFVRGGLAVTRDFPVRHCHGH
jgi:hypothetical protein